MRPFLLVLLLIVSALLTGCDPVLEDHTDEAAGKVQQTAAKIETGVSGLTVEQENVKRRLEADNKPGALKFIYFISPFTGDVISYSSVKGKVTSSGKRLKPTESANYNQYGADLYYYTQQVMGDDGTFGSSNEYIYWWDVKGVYHQAMPGACMWYVSDQPLRVSKTALRLDRS